ncbi:uncharacterized protein LOC143371190 [Andrena cerasifolii]|uniref:uncharacterized protein LOC143371190 n=1 Tax=Andrena cerasifolii TaxID=2819439 RepID=UPI0040380064
MHVIKGSSHIGLGIACQFRYIRFIYQMETIHQYLEIVKYDWNNVQNERELDIMKEHTRMGRFYVMILARKEQYQQKFMRCIVFRPNGCETEIVKALIYFAVFVYAIFFTIITCPFVADVLDWIIPLNESRPHELPARLEMFIDQETHYYLCASILDSLLFTCGLLTVATDAIMIMWLLHCCGLFAIASYRVREAFACNSRQIHISERSIQMTKLLANAVDIHIKATKFVDRIKHNFLATYGIFLIIGVVVQTINLFLMSEAILLNKIGDIVLYGMCALGEYVYIFYLIYIVEQIMDSHKSIFVELCNTKWYEAPSQVQKLILFMMLRCSIPISSNMFNMFSISLEGFSLVRSLLQSTEHILFILKPLFFLARLVTSSCLCFHTILLHIKSNDYIIVISSYHIKIVVLDSINDSYITEAACNRNRRAGVARAVLMHNRAHTFLKDVKSAVTLVYSILLILGVTSLSTNLFSLSQSTLEGDNIEDTLISMMFVISEMGYMFYGNFVSQKMIDSGGDIFTDVYNTEWYKMPVPTQKLLLFIMLKSVITPSCKLLLAYNPSIEGFSTLIRTSVSYFMVISSVH